MQSAVSLTLTALGNIPLVEQGDDLAAIALRGLADTGIPLEDGDVMVLAHKIVSKAEGRLVRLGDVKPSPRAVELARQCGKDARFCEVVLWDTREVLRVREGLIVVETIHGWVCANAGIDRSNVAPHDGDEWVLRLPEDADRSARALRQALRERTSRDVGIVVDDTHGRAWRNGAVGVAIGVAGLPAVEDLRGRADLFGYHLQVTTVGLADQIASAASLLQGQADEGRPIVHVRGVQLSPTGSTDEAAWGHQGGSAHDIVRDKESDLFR
ncbi:MAG: coenzyme F420-0:L-glutamate ligase [Chloroflexi bacterium]|nr:coenzyme F420-0:L-glutamate ligase [Chloroflexota bacterium]